jgi:23S rRNA pseudouridine2605 synthase
MRINQYVATSSGISRRAADRAINAGQVLINEQPARVGQLVEQHDIIKFNDQQLVLPERSTTIIINKPVGYVCSRNGQGSKTIYDLLPTEFHDLKSVGRLDKDSSGLLLMTDDGQLANHLTHPSFAKQKIYNISVDHSLEEEDQASIERGVTLEDGVSAFKLQRLNDDKTWEITMHEGRNRQIRRTFIKLGYNVLSLKRLTFGDYQLNDLAEGSFVIQQ